MDGTVFRGSGGKLKPLGIKPGEAPAVHDAGKVRPVDGCPHKIFRIRNRKQDRAAVMSRNIQEVPASGFLLVVTGTENIHGVAVVAPSRLEEGGNGGIADA